MLKKIRNGHWFLPELTKTAEETYDCTYIAKYEGYEKTELGKEIDRERQKFVDSMVSKDCKIVDVGVGSGQFMYKRNCLGYDVNPLMARRLRDEGRFVDIYNKEELELENIKCVTFFDSFEHIKDPSMILRNLPEDATVIVSMPMIHLPEGIDEVETIKNWKHYREDEHHHYFSLRGFLMYMAKNGFLPRDVSSFETRLGREDIYTVCFTRELEQ